MWVRVAASPALVPAGANKPPSCPPDNVRLHLRHALPTCQSSRCADRCTDHGTIDEILDFFWEFEMNVARCSCCGAQKHALGVPVWGLTVDLSGLGTDTPYSSLACS
jgi:hypothetical protein